MVRAVEGEMALAEEESDCGTAMVTPAVVREVLTAYECRLRESESPILRNPAATAQLMDQAGAVLDTVAVGLNGIPRAIADEQDKLSVEIGISRALRGIHPSESLAAAAVLFEVTLPVLADKLRSQQAGDDAVEAAAIKLHRAILERIAVGSVSYASFLLQKVHTSHLEERRRVARELHDRAAHDVGVALQKIAMYKFHLDGNTALANCKLDAAVTVLHQAVDAIRQLSADLRESIAEHGGMEPALSQYLSTRAGAGVRTSVSVTGDVDSIPAPVAEEVYMVVREAIRNAFVHSGTKVLEVRIEVGEEFLVARVRDEGDGFDLSAPMSAPMGLGLTSMRERCELLGGNCSITSEPGHGTTVEIVIPAITIAT